MNLVMRFRGNGGVRCRFNTLGEVVDCHHNVFMPIGGPCCFPYNIQSLQGERPKCSEIMELGCWSMNDISMGLPMMISTNEITTVVMHGEPNSILYGGSSWQVHVHPCVDCKLRHEFLSSFPWLLLHRGNISVCSEDCLQSCLAQMVNCAAN